MTMQNKLEWNGNADSSNLSEQVIDKPVVRAFIDDDASACAEIFDLAGRQAFFWVPWPRMDQAAFTRVTCDEIVRVAVLGGAVMGFIGIYVPDKFIHHLYVHPKAQRIGLGNALLSDAEAFLGPGAHLKCQMRNLPARSFYRARGWTEDIEMVEADDIGNWTRISYAGPVVG